MIPHIEIKTDGCRTDVFVNGEKLEGVSRVSFVQDKIKEPILQIDMLAMDMTINAVMLPALPEVFRKWYELKEPSDDGSED